MGNIDIFFSKVPESIPVDPDTHYLREKKQPQMIAQYVSTYQRDLMENSIMSQKMGRARP